MTILYVGMTRGTPNALQRPLVIDMITITFYSVIRVLCIKSKGKLNCYIMRRLTDGAPVTLPLLFPPDPAEVVTPAPPPVGTVCVFVVTAAWVVVTLAAAVVVVLRHRRLPPRRARPGY